MYMLLLLSSHRSKQKVESSLGQAKGRQTSWRVYKACGLVAWTKSFEAFSTSHCYCDVVRPTVCRPSCR